MSKLYQSIILFRIKHLRKSQRHSEKRATDPKPKSASDLIISRQKSINNQFLPQTNNETAIDWGVTKTALFRRRLSNTWCQHD